MNYDHTILQAARLTGLTTHVIRAWERRYGVLTPTRTPSNRRLYSEQDIEKLTLLRKAVQSGSSIGRVAHLPLEDLRRIVAENPVIEGNAAEHTPPQSPDFLEECLQAIERLDAEALDRGLARASAMLGTAAVIDHLIVPMLKKIGEGWSEGNLRIANEHMASVVLRTYLIRTFAALQAPISAPQLIVTTPTGQHHEFGALLAAVTAALQGWRVLYLGPNLPAEEIAGAARRNGAKAIALSIVYPPDDPQLPGELLTLGKCLGKDIPILVGGHASAAYRDALEAIDAIVPEDLTALRTELQAIRSR